MVSPDIVSLDEFEELRDRTRKDYGKERGNEDGHYISYSQENFEGIELICRTHYWVEDGDFDILDINYFMCKYN